MIACSGGADSVALLVALASAEPERLHVAHVHHDMRPEHESKADEQHVAGLVASLDLPFHARAVTGATTEAKARRLRYDALTDIARVISAPLIATGHHADDQLETFLMRAMRGAGPRGLAGIRERRVCDNGIALIRPMLGVTHGDCLDLCREAGVAWREDATNTDTSRTRAALRSQVLPALRTIRSDAAHRVTDAARLQAGVQAMIDQRVLALRPEAGRWERRVLASTERIVLGELLRRGAVHAGLTRPDRLTGKQLQPVIRKIRGDDAQTRVFEWAQGVRVRVNAHEVRIYRDAPSAPIP